ncbi:MAG: alpha/beta hydrolase [Gaiellaceae bacterium]|jgi:pimeloyl-ACP methyl ester carboxylesterase
MSESEPDQASSETTEKRQSRFRLPRRGRPLIRRRWLRWTVRVLVGLFVFVTLFSFVYNLATNGDQKPASALYPGPYVQIEGRQVAYRELGSRGAPIIFLGGFAEPSWVWEQVARRLALDHRVYALDLPPFGYSERKGPYTLAGWTRLVRDFTAHFGLENPLIVGHSLGAAVAVNIGLQAPANTAGVVLLDGDALPVGGPHWIANLFINPYYTTLFRLVTHADWLIRGVLQQAYGPDRPPITNAVVDAFERPFRVDGTESGFHDLLRGGVQGLTLADLRRLTVPRLVLWGQHDTVDDIKAGRTSAQALGVRLIVIPRAGHLSMLGQPEAVAKAIARFAARIERMPRVRVRPARAGR